MVNPAVLTVTGPVLVIDKAPDVAVTLPPFVITWLPPAVTVPVLVIVQAAPLLAVLVSMIVADCAVNATVLVMLVNAEVGGVKLLV